VTETPHQGRQHGFVYYHNAASMTEMTEFGFNASSTANAFAINQRDVVGTDSPTPTPTTRAARAASLRSRRADGLYGSALTSTTT
jgi:hypothetical protein